MNPEIKRARRSIQGRVFKLILLTVLLLTAAYALISYVNDERMSELMNDAGIKQQKAIGITTSSVMEDMIRQTLGRANKTEARIAGELFSSTKSRVLYLKRYAEKLLADPEAYEPQAYAGPDPADDGTWTAKVIYAEGTDPSDPALRAKLGLLANMTDIMTELSPAFNASKVYIGLPEGAHITVSDNSSNWFKDGELISYDPRTRVWYQEAVEKNGLIFTEGEKDITTGEYCIECAAPIYGPDGSLQAVVGADLFLTEMDSVLRSSSMEGESSLLINQSGHAVLISKEDAFPMAEEDKVGDLRQSKVPMLAQIVENALQGKSTSVVLGEMQDGKYYVTARPIEGTGWVLISAYSQEVSDRPFAHLLKNQEDIQKSSMEQHKEQLRKSRGAAAVLLSLLSLLTLGLAFWLGRRIVRPLKTMTQKIAVLGKEERTFKMDDAYRTGDEVEDLAQSFADVTEKASSYMDEVLRVTAEKERIGAELSLATDIQAAMLPHIFPAFPNRHDFDIYARMDPAKEVGGDFYDYFLIDEDHLGMVMADVSGKGVPAALFMMASKIILQSVAMLGHSPAQILSKTNEAICSSNEAEMFVTVWLGILELSTGKLVASNAGHEYPILKSPSGEFEIFKDMHGFVIGAMETSKYTEYEVQLEPGAKLFVYTDGVPEATNAENELFGVERTIQALNRLPDAAPLDVLKNVRKAVDDFVQEAEQFDDLTMLCMEYKGPVPEEEKKEL